MSGTVYGLGTVKEGATTKIVNKGLLLLMLLGWVFYLIFNNFKRGGMRHKL